MTVEEELDIIKCITKITLSTEAPQEKINNILKLIVTIYNANSITLEYSNRTITYQNGSQQNNQSINQTINISDNNLYNLIVNNPTKKVTENFTTQIINNLSLAIYAINMQEKLQIDPLTKLQSRHAYEQRKKQFNRKNDGANIGICYIDANYLKDLNDNQVHGGHDIGDKLLQIIANCVQRIFRINDSYRIGGDEFIIIAENIEEELFTFKINELYNLIEEEKQKLINRINDSSIDKSFQIDGELISYGICYQKEINSPEELEKSIKIAEDKMRQYKEDFHSRHKTIR